MVGGVGREPGVARGADDLAGAGRGDVGGPGAVLVVVGLLGGAVLVGLDGAGDAGVAVGGQDGDEAAGVVVAQADVGVVGLAAAAGLLACDKKRENMFINQFVLH